MNHALDQLQQATLRLTLEGSLKDRLAEAYRDHVRDLDASSLPEALRDEFDALHVAMHSAVPQPRECVIRASVRKMSNVEVRMHAALVVRAFAAVARANADEMTLLQRTPRQGASAQVLPLFAEA
jgi:hypothetical protein